MSIIITTYKAQNQINLYPDWFSLSHELTVKKAYAIELNSKLFD